jgi:hypothetical protein
MATSKFFNNKKITIPGVYSTIKSGIKNPPITSDYSKVLIIDTGTTPIAGWGGGSGINGQLASGQDAIYQFTDLNTYREFLKGGLLWKVAEGLFTPDGAENGVSTLYHVKAATTTKATLVFTATGGGAAGGTVNFSPKDEGIIANGKLDSSNDDNLYKGYAYTIESGVKDTDKWIFKVWRGSYTGLYSGDSISYDGVSKTASSPILLAQSPEFDNMSTLISWMEEDASFGEYFELNSSSTTGTGVVNSADMTGKSDYQVSSSVGVEGTENFSASDLTDALEAVKDLHYTHILCDRYGTTSGTAQIETVTLPATSAATQGDYILLYNHTGETVAVWLDIDGDGTAPTGTNYVNANYKVEVDIATGGSSATNGTAFYEALKAQTSWSSQVTLLNNGDGTVTITQGDAGDVTDAIPKDASDATAGSITSSTDADGADGTTTYNGSQVGAIVTHIQTDAKYDKYMFFGGGKDVTEFDQSSSSSKVYAEYFDSEQVIVVHGNVKKSSNLTASGFRTWPTLYHAAVCLGRIAGLPPQVPGTLKSIGVEGLAHNLTDNEKEVALDAGIMVSYFDNDFNDFVILQAINTEQNNDNLINSDASSFSHQINRIKAQLNYDLVTNAKIDLLGDPSGVNRNTLSPTQVYNWTEKFLKSKVASASQDNLLVATEDVPNGFKDITVTRTQDNYNITYGFVPNGEITKLFFTGVIIG